jgi:prepilin-type N-terminal cleavage/methylation domain-containing protein
MAGRKGKREIESSLDSQLQIIETAVKPSRYKISGLTLIELLVVIAIIVVLAALLLPGLSRAKNQAAKTTDLDNLHQIMVAEHIYTGDNNEVLTWPNWDYGAALPDGTARAGWLYKLDLSIAGPAAFVAQGGLLWDSLRTAKSFLCPLDQPVGSKRAQQLSSYIMNGAVIGFRSGFHANVMPVKISEMWPGDCLLFEADERDPGNFNDGSSWPLEGVTTRHAQGATRSAIDGSVSYIHDETWLNDVTDTNKNYLWCYPRTVDGGDPVYGHDK